MAELYNSQLVRDDHSLQNKLIGDRMPLTFTTKHSSLSHLRRWVGLLYPLSAMQLPAVQAQQYPM